jgi:polysaccharide biosynthesis transport protein
MKLVTAPRHYYDVFRRRAWIIAVVAALAVGGALLQLTSRSPQYQAEASILVTPEGIVPTAFNDARFSAIQRAYRETVLNNVVYLLKSRTVSARAAEQVGGLSAEDLARRVTVKHIPGTDILIISAVDERPDHAALIANAMAQELANFYGEMYRAGAASARQFIEEQLGVAQDRLSASEQAVLEFQARTGALALPDEVSRTARRILDQQAAYEAASLDETTAQTRVAAIRSHLASQNDGQLASLSIATNPVIAQIRDHLTGLELQLADLRQVYTDQHPTVQALLGKIAAERERLSAEAEKVLSDKSLGMSPAREQFVREMISGEVDAAAARARAAGLHAILGRLQARLNGVSGNELALVRLQRDVKDAEQLVTRLSALQQDAVLRESQAVAFGQTAIAVVDPAVAPARPISLPFARTAALAGLLGLCLGAALALAVQSAESRIRSTPRTEVAPGVPAPAAISPLDVRRSFRYLPVALGMSIALLPVILVALGVVPVVGVVVSAYGAQAGTVLAHVAPVGQALTQAFHAVHGLYVAEARAMPPHVIDFSQLLIQTISTVP